MTPREKDIPTVFHLIYIQRVNTARRLRARMAVPKFLIGSCVLKGEGIP
jgi:hypothetical protein